MSLQDPIANMLIAIKNSQLAFKKMLIVDFSIQKLSILKILKKENYILFFF